MDYGKAAMPGFMLADEAMRRTYWPIGWQLSKAISPVTR